jgi:hypothetical protein
MSKISEITLGEFRKNLQEYVILTKRANEQFIISKNGEAIGAFIPMTIFQKMKSLNETSADLIEKQQS